MVHEPRVPREARRGVGETVKIQDIVEQLGQFGLAADEAQVYVHLTRQGKAKASDVAKQTSLPRARVYRILETLIQRGVVQATLTRPTQFQAVPPNRVFEAAFHEHEGRWEKLQQTREDIEKALVGLAAGPASNDGGVKFRTIHGRAECFQEMERLVRNAQSSVLVVAVPQTLAVGADMQSVFDLSLRRGIQGLKVDLVLPPQEAGSPLGAFAKQGRVNVRSCAKPGPARFAVADRAEALLWMNADASSRRSAGEDACLWTNAPLVVGALVAAFEAMVAASEQDIEA